MKRLSVPEARRALHLSRILQTLFLCSLILFAACAQDDTEEETQNGSLAEYTLVRTLSDEAQRKTIAFDALAFLTGNLGDQSFLPPGKVADFSGFQYLRDNDPTEMGHNTDFVTIVAFNILHRLSQEQLDLLVAAARDQVERINAFAYARFPLLDAFRRQLEADYPTTSTGLDKEAVMACTADLYLLDGEISLRRAQVMGQVLRGLDNAQVLSLDSLLNLGGVGNWERGLSDPLSGLHLEHDENVAVMTFASEMWSWYAGSIEADTYFCPERQGTYFGSFYLKDWPAMGNPDYTIDEQLTARAGEDFLGLLTASQRSRVEGLVDLQRDELLELVETRRAIATLLRGYMLGEDVDTQAVLSLSEHYGALDGSISCEYALAFSQVGRDLDEAQRQDLEALSSSLGYQASSGAFLYSEPIAMPAIPNTDFLFGSSGDTFTLSSPAVDSQGLLSVDCTCDGVGTSPALEWAGLPEACTSLALIMHHVAIDSTVHCYWILHDIPADLGALPAAVTDIGIWGANTVNGLAAYAPPCSQGPGAKTYEITLYALSAPVDLPQAPTEVDRDDMLAAMADRTLSTAVLQATYTRPE